MTMTNLLFNVSVWGGTAWNRYPLLNVLNEEKWALCFKRINFRKMPKKPSLCQRGDGLCPRESRGTLRATGLFSCSPLRNPGISTKLRSKWGASQRIKCPCTHKGSWCRLIELPDWYLLGAYPLHLVLCWVSVQTAYHSFSGIWLPLPICINPPGHWSLQPLLQLCHETTSDNHNDNYNQSSNPDIWIMI